MMSYELEGTIKVIGNTQIFDSGFQKREFVVTTDEKYPQDVKLEVLKDNCDTLDSYNAGDVVNVSFNVRGNEYKDRYFVSLQAWRIKPLETAGAKAPATVPSDDSPNFDEDLPFWFKADRETHRPSLAYSGGGLLRE